MMGIFSWFSKSSPPDYETLLSRLATDINDAKQSLAEIRLRERRMSLLINAYGIGLWVLWSGLWWVRGLPLGLIGLRGDKGEGRLIGVAGMAAGPLFIWLLNRLLQLWFTRQRNAEELHLRTLLGEQRKHLEAIKKATNFDSTRKLIEQYEGGSPGPSLPSTPHNSNPSTPQKQQTAQGSPGQNGSPRGGLEGTPKAPGHLVGIGGTPLVGPSGPIPLPPGMTADQATMLQMQMAAIQPVLPTPEKKWYDRVVDSILGDDPSQSSQSKYALVCGECFRHNGLVGSQYEWERLRCNHLNPPPLSRSNPSLAPSDLKTSTAPTTPVVSPSPLMRTRGTPRGTPLRERGTTRSSKLGQEVFNASETDAEE
ncbi:hypothetical protein TREMEDRAFT_71568 [Tremella mesenterica DSM 1558]|uniref:uncharacterized protein n=1 Tax=Tremella mesenterica (strain ATCC 24925 / CBS 8224 / DSM 1558 / NBRC 9311 / NRRL Y-6157 / RJB 2259-6 / UBC 559-6) TaxID=578456 RepID=UPI0003F48DC6|nr:uncharacterized protein TREMEDRAFT_71568 [Tremella mesenterica DSM 1558]EIW70260.1 hypothetical protein TREMEDRAFT_71568 [Tremella mesenterica DSM 1558]